MPPRTVAYLTPLFFDDQSCIGGGERYAHNLARGVVKRSQGHTTVDLLSFGPEAKTVPLSPGIRLRILAWAGRPALPLDAVSWDLPEAIADCDLLHIHQAYTRCAEVGLLVAKLQRKPVCVTDHGGFTSPHGLDVGSLELADQIVAYSDFGASLYRTRTPIAVVKGGVDAGHFCPPRERPQRDRILYVGRLLPHKGIDRLIQALPVDLPLTVCGRPYHDDYFRLLNQLAAGKRVEFVTTADDETIRGYYARAWANVLPSVHQDCYGCTHPVPELMGFTLLEAMACGTPAIAARTAAMPEFIRHGETGFVFDTIDELADQLNRLAGDAALVERMGRAARLEVEREYDLTVAGGQMLSIYERLTARAREAAA